MKWDVYAMRCDCYVVFDEVTCLWYDMLKTCSGYVVWLLSYMICYVYDVDCYFWKHEDVMIWYMCDMNNMIWLKWKTMN